MTEMTRMSGVLGTLLWVGAGGWGEARADTFDWYGNAGTSNWQFVDTGILGAASNWYNRADGQYDSRPGTDDDVVFGAYGFDNGTPFSDSDRTVRSLTFTGNNASTNIFLSFQNRSTNTENNTLTLTTGDFTAQRGSFQGNMHLGSYGRWEITENAALVGPFAALTGAGFTMVGGGNLEINVADTSLSGGIAVEDGTLTVDPIAGRYVAGDGDTLRGDNGRGVVRVRFRTPDRQDPAYVVRVGGTMSFADSIPALGNPAYEVGVVELEGGTARFLDNVVVQELRASAVYQQLGSFRRLLPSIVESEAYDPATPTPARPIYLGSTRGQIFAEDAGSSPVLRVQAGVVSPQLDVVGGGTVRFDHGQRSARAVHRVAEWNIFNGNVRLANTRAALDQTQFNVGGSSSPTSLGQLTLTEVDQQLSATDATVQLNPNGTLLVDNVADTLGRLVLNGGNVVGSLGGSNTLQLRSTQSILALRDGTVRGVELDLLGNDAIVAVASGNTLEITGPISNGGIRFASSGATLIQHGGTYAGDTQVNSGQMVLRGSAADSRFSVSNSTLLSEGGTVRGLTGNAVGTGTVVLGDGGLTITPRAGDDHVFAGSITADPAAPDAGLTLRGPGSQTLAGPLSYTGLTDVQAGRLALRGTNTGIGNSAGVSVAADATFDISQTTSGATLRDLRGRGTVDLGDQTLRLALDDPASFSGSIRGDGGLTLQRGTFLSYGNLAYTGATRVVSGALGLFGDNPGIGNSSGLLLEAGTLLDIANTTDGVTLRGLTGSGGVLTGDRTLRLSLAQNNTFNGSIGGGGELIKRGPGSLTLGRTQGNTYAGGTILQGGTLITANTTGSATGRGQVLIDGGTLAGNGVIAPDNDAHVILADGQIRPGTSPGILTFALAGGSTLRLEGGSLAFELGTASDLVRLTGGDRLRGRGTTLALALTAGFSYDQTYTLFENVDDAGDAFCFAGVTGIDADRLAQVFHNADLGAYQIRFAVIPEPTTAAALAVLIAATTTRRRIRPEARQD